LSRFLDITLANLPTESLCCAFDGERFAEGLADKRAWTRDRLREGGVFRKLGGDAKVFVEYMPAERAWRPVEAPGRLVIHCLWVSGDHSRRGIAREILDSVKAETSVGVCAVAHRGMWAIDSTFYEKMGFVETDRAPGGFSLMSWSPGPDGDPPRFTAEAKIARVTAPGVLIAHADQCPFARDLADEMAEAARDLGFEATIRRLETAEAARESGSPFGTVGVFLDGAFLTHQLEAPAAFSRRLVPFAGR